MVAKLQGCSACRDMQDVFPFSMAFQPIVDTELACIEGHEALVRGPSQESAAHVLAQLTPVNLYAFDQACRVRAIELATKLGLRGKLSINFLPNAVYEPAACIRLTLDAARRTGFPLDRLTFEIVETETIAETGHLQRIISEYQRHGFRVALDDFGTSYSGLARLADLRPDIIKLDRALVRDCDRDATRLAIVRNLLNLGRELGIKVILEGVERVEELETLRAAGGRFMQGFLFARPMFEGLVPDAAIRIPVPA